MNLEIPQLLENYLDWLRQKTTFREVDSWVEITTPYLDRNNDYIQIYAKHSDDRIILTDDSYTIHDLEMSGCKLESPKRRELLSMTLRGFGVHLRNSELYVEATPVSFASKKHDLIQAMLAVNDLFYLASPIVSSLFLEDVKHWLDDNEVRYTPRIKVTGRSGFDHVFDFVIPKSKNMPERFIQTINQPNRTNAEKVAFAWLDTRDTRDKDAKSYALINDVERSISSSVLDAIKNYHVTPVVWSDRYRVTEELAN